MTKMKDESILGEKLGMSQAFDGQGRRLTLTKIKLAADKPALKPGEAVLVSGITKGKGFSGVMKRWGFKGGPRTHGQSDRQRAVGSIGQGTDPGRVWKGKKMPGRAGGQKATIKGLKVVSFDEKTKTLAVNGPVPGAKRGKLKIRKR